MMQVAALLLIALAMGALMSTPEQRAEADRKWIRPFVRMLRIPLAALALIWGVILWQAFAQR